MHEARIASAEGLIAWRHVEIGPDIAALKIKCDILYHPVCIKFTISFACAKYKMLNANLVQYVFYVQYVF